MTLINKLNELLGNDAGLTKSGLTKAVAEGKLPQRDAKDLGTSGAFIPSMYTGNPMAEARKKLGNKIASIENKIANTGAGAEAQPVHQKSVKAKGKAKKPKEGKKGAGKITKKFVKLPRSSSVFNTIRSYDALGKVSNIAVVDYTATANDYRGELIEQFKSEGKKVNVETFAINQSHASVNKQLSAIKQGTNGQKFDAVNMPIICEMKYSDLETELGIANVTADTLESRREEILDSMAQNDDYKLQHDSINIIESLIKDETPVYVADNSEEDGFNLYSLAKGSEIV